jgi:hypothetical protein
MEHAQHYPKSIDPVDLFNKRKISANIIPFFFFQFVFYGVIYLDLIDLVFIFFNFNL